MTPTIDPERLAECERVPLTTGSHRADGIKPPTPSTCGACIEEMRAYVYGLPWSDSPQIEDGVIASLLRAFNDGWLDGDRQKLKRFLALPPTKGGSALETRRAIACLDWTLRVHRPLWFDAAGLPEHAAAMRALPEIVDEATSKVAIEAQQRGIIAVRAAWVAWAAREEWEAREAREAIASLVAAHAATSLGPTATDAERREVGLAALDLVVQQVREAELALVERLVAMAEEG